MLRSLLFVPGDSERKLEKGFASGADAVIVDLEDSVAPENKVLARGLAAEFVRGRGGNGTPQVYFRVNDLSTGLTGDDLAAVVGASPAGIMLPKANSLADIDQLSTRLRVEEARAGLPDGAIRILPIITESAAGVLAAASYRGGHPRLVGITWGAEDLAADIGALANRDGEGRYTELFRLARSMTLLAATVACVEAIDTVVPNFRDLEGFGAECLEAERDGFCGKMAIHPAQVPVINRVFTPSTERVSHAAAIVEAFRAAGNPGVIGIGGKMYDRPHLKNAERLLARARAAGIA